MRAGPTIVPSHSPPTLRAPPLKVRCEWARLPCGSVITDSTSKPKAFSSQRRAAIGSL
jgi:hypothetical protein